MNTDPMKEPANGQLGTITDAFTPGVVKISCGCAPERSAKCLQRGRTREEDGSLNLGSPLNKQCHIFVLETDLLHMAHDVVSARFLSTERAEQPLIDLNPFSDDIPDQLQPGGRGPPKKKRKKKTRRKK